MIFEDAHEFLASLPHGQATAGLDLGTHTIGIAVSDTFLSVATPLETIKRHDALPPNSVHLGGLALGVNPNA